MVKGRDEYCLNIVYKDKTFMIIFEEVIYCIYTIVER